jgi:ribosome-associated heat shock protein Hsp15
MAEAQSPSHRLDKWLWCARVTKSRTLAQGLVTAGHVRINRARTRRASHELRSGDVLTIAVGGRVRVLKVVSFALRRGPPADARALYEDLTPPHPAAPDGMPEL